MRVWWSECEFRPTSLKKSCHVAVVWMFQFAFSYFYNFLYFYSFFRHFSSCYFKHDSISKINTIKHFRCTHLQKTNLYEILAGLSTFFSCVSIKLQASKQIVERRSNGTWLNLCAHLSSTTLLWWTIEPPASSLFTEIPQLPWSKFVWTHSHLANHTIQLKSIPSAFIVFLFNISMKPTPNVRSTARAIVFCLCYSSRWLIFDPFGNHTLCLRCHQVFWLIKIDTNKEKNPSRSRQRW